MNALATSLVNFDGSPLVVSQAQATTYNHAMMAAAYAAANTGSRSLGGWNRRLTSADGALLPDREALVGGSRKLAKDSGWIAGGFQTLQDTIVGPAPRVMANPNWKALGLDPEWAEEFGEECEGRFALWAEDPLNRCDVERQTNFAGLLNLAVRHRMIDGESFLLPYSMERGGPSSLALRVVDPDRLSNPDGRFDDETLRRGVELDGAGAPKGYYIRSVHPSDTFGWGQVNTFKWDYVPAYTSWGRRRAIHAFEASQASQHRGAPLLAPVMERVYMEDKYAKAELEAAILNSLMSASLKSPLDPAMALGSLQTQTGGDPASMDPLAYQADRLKFHQATDIDVGGAQVNHLFPGEELIFHRSERPNSAFPEFEATALRYIASGMGLSYEMLSKDWSKSNYSSARGALVEAHKFMTARRTPFVNGVATQIYVLWLEEEIAMGRIELPKNAPPFHQAMAAYARCTWIGPSKGVVDPTKEAQGSLMRMDGGTSSLLDECLDVGKDWREVTYQRHRELKLLDKLGMPETTWAVISQTDPLADEDTDQEVDEETGLEGGNKETYVRQPKGQRSKVSRMSTLEGRIAKMESLQVRAAARAGAQGTSYHVD